MKLIDSFLLLFVFLLPQFSIDKLENFKYFFGLIALLKITQELLKGTIRVKSRGFLPFFLFFLLCAVSLLWTSKLSFEKSFLFSIGSMLVFSYSYFLLLSNEGNLRKVLAFFSVGVVFAALQVLILSIVKSNVFIVSGRANIIGMDANESAIILCIGLAIFLFFFQYRKIRVLKVLVVVIIIVAILLTGSRTGSIALVTVISFLISKAKLKPYARILLLLVFLFSILFSAEYVKSSFSIINEQGNIDLQGRDETWKTGVGIYIKSERKMLGFGYESFSAELSRVMWKANAHNVFLKVVFELGIVGCLLFILILYESGKYVLRRDHPLRLLYLSIYLIILFSFLTLSWIFYLITWFFIVLLYKTARIPAVWYKL